MNPIKLLAALIIATGFAVPAGHAAKTRPTQAQAQAQAQAPAQPLQIQPLLQALPTPQPLPIVEQKCLRALNGACTNPVVVEAARLRAIIVPAVRVSYLGTPAGTVGGKYITFERFFQDNPLVFGLPTYLTILPCCYDRSK